MDAFYEIAPDNVNICITSFVLLLVLEVLAASICVIEEEARRIEKEEGSANHIDSSV